MVWEPHLKGRNQGWNGNLRKPRQVSTDVSGCRIGFKTIAPWTMESNPRDGTPPRPCRDQHEQHAALMMSIQVLLVGTSDTLIVTCATRHDGMVTCNV